MSHDLLPEKELWRYFVEVRLWPLKAKFDPEGWLSNFSDHELPFAKRLLAGFTYYSAELVEQMFRSAFANVSQLVVASRDDMAVARRQWKTFLDQTTVVRVTGEEPHDADSGFIFARMSRDSIGIPEANIRSPEEALTTLAARHYGDIVFVDDFVGSGNQFVDTWEREYVIAKAALSFRSVVQSYPHIRCYYVPVLCTETGRTEIQRRCPSVQVVPAHFIGPRHSALDPDSIIWRGGMQAGGPQFVETASRRAGIPDKNGAVGCWRGFHKLGLAIGFSHGYPDATLPLFYWRENGWKPLLKKDSV